MAPWVSYRWLVQPYGIVRKLDAEKARRNKGPRSLDDSFKGEDLYQQQQSATGPANDGRDGVGTH